jgi:hypothetical protein
MQAWSQFYAVVVAASAALLGLLFVVISINAPATLGLEETVSRRLTEQAFQNYLTVLMVGLLALFAGISTVVFGWVTLAATAGWSVWVVVRFVQAIMTHGERRSWLAGVRRASHFADWFWHAAVRRFAHGAELGRRLQLAGGPHTSADVLGDDRIVGVVDANRSAQEGLTDIFHMAASSHRTCGA